MKRNFKLNENEMIRVINSDRKSVVFEIRTNKNGYKTYIKLSKDQYEKLISDISYMHHIGPKPSMKVENILIKHRSYTKFTGENDFSYKFYDGRGYIELNMVEDIIVISIKNSYRTLESVHTKYWQVKEMFDKLQLTVNELSFREWRR